MAEPAVLHGAAGAAGEEGGVRAVFPPPPQAPVQRDGTWHPSFRQAVAFAQDHAHYVHSEAGPAYRVVRKLRDSLFGKVYQGELHYVDGARQVLPGPGVKVALKILSIANVRARRTMDGRPVDEDALQEMAFMQQLSNPGHPNLLRLYECLEDRRHFYVVMEFVDGGELYDVLCDRGRLDELHAKQILRQLARGLAHLHAHSVAHRDLSLENAMVTSDGSVKIIDYGLAVRVPRGADGRHALLEPPVRSGKRVYQPPEVFQGLVPYDAFAFDRWSLGIIAFSLSVGNPPFEAAHITDSRYRLVQERSLGDLVQVWGLEPPSPACLDFCQSLVRIHPPGDRLALEHCLAHPWIVEQ